MTPIDTARTLGTEHGTRDAEAWLTIPRCSVCGTRRGSDCPPLSHGLLGETDRPEPDLTGAYSERQLVQDCGLAGTVATGERWSMDGYRVLDTYIAAYRAAVEATIREAVGQ